MKNDNYLMLMNKKKRSEVVAESPGLPGGLCVYVVSK
jgi:hypothetical protein